MVAARAYHQQYRYQRDWNNFGMGTKAEKQESSAQQRLMKYLVDKLPRRADKNIELVLGKHVHDMAMTDSAS